MNRLLNQHRIMSPAVVASQAEGRLAIFLRHLQLNIVCAGRISTADSPLAFLVRSPMLCRRDMSWRRSRPADAANRHDAMRVFGGLCSSFARTSGSRGAFQPCMTRMNSAFIHILTGLDAR